LFLEKIYSRVSRWSRGAPLVFVAVAIVYSNSPSVSPDLFGFASLFFVAFSLVGLSFLARLFIDGEVPRITIDHFAPALVAWTSVTLISLLRSDVPELSFFSAYADIYRAVGFAIVLFLIIERIDQFRAALASILAVTLFLASLTVFQFLFGLQTSDFSGWALGGLEQIVGATSGFRPSGTIGDPNYYGMYLIPGVLLGFHHTVNARTSLARVWFGCSSAVIVFAVALTASRGASFALIFGIIAWLAGERGAWKTIALIVVSATAALILNPDYLQRILVPIEVLARIVSDGNGLGVDIDESSIFGRISQLQVSLILFLENPVSGIGFGQFETFFQSQTVQNNLLMRGEDRSAHNYYLEIGAEQGLFGLFGLFIFVVMLSRSIGKSSSRFSDLEMETDARLIRTFGYVIFSVLLCLLTLQDSHPLQLWTLFAIAFSAGSVARTIDREAAAKGSYNMYVSLTGKKI
jgi:O-antigen ligase